MTPRDGNGRLYEVEWVELGDGFDEVVGLGRGRSWVTQLQGSDAFTGTEALEERPEETRAEPEVGVGSWK